MSTLHCPLCGLRFRYGSELDVHVREDHAPPAQLHVPAPRHRGRVEPVKHLPALDWPR